MIKIALSMYILEENLLQNRFAYSRGRERFHVECHVNVMVLIRPSLFANSALQPDQRNILYASAAIAHCHVCEQFHICSAGITLIDRELGFRAVAMAAMASVATATPSCGGCSAHTRSALQRLAPANLAVAPKCNLRRGSAAVALARVVARAAATNGTATDVAGGGE